MKHGAKQKQRYSDDHILDGDLRPTVPIVEICGAERVLVENHQGVAGYSCKEIKVNVAGGKILICGDDLHLSRMNRGALVIRGRICAVNLLRSG